MYRVQYVTIVLPYLMNCVLRMIHRLSLLKSSPYIHRAGTGAQINNRNSEWGFTDIKIL